MRRRRRLLGALPVRRWYVPPVTVPPDAGGVVEDGWLRRERAELVALLGSLDHDAWRRPTECPAWDVRQIALHILGDDLSLLSRQRDEATNGLLLFAQEHPGADFRQLLDGFNEQWVTAASFLGPTLLIELLDLTGDWTADFYEQVDLGSPGEPVGFFGTTQPSPYWQVASRELVERWVHQHQIRRAVGAPDLDDTFLAVAAGVFVRAISLRLGDLGVPTGEAIALEVTGVAAWSLRRTAEGWSLGGGVEPDATTTISFSAATARRLFSRAPDVPGEDAEISTRGDDSVATAALTAMGQMFA